MINNILLVRLRTSIRDHPCEKGNPQMLNRSETDEHPYNICLTSADKTSSSEFKRIQTDRVFVIVFVNPPPCPSVTIRVKKVIHRRHRIHRIEIRVYPCTPWKNITAVETLHRRRWRNSFFKTAIASNYPAIFSRKHFYDNCRYIADNCCWPVRLRTQHTLQWTL